VIVLRAKDVEFEVTYIDLLDKPDWFLKISPHGKVPVLLVDDRPLFESSAIAEFLDEAVGEPLHPADLYKRARNRAWTDFTPDFATGLSGIYYKPNLDTREDDVEAARKRVARLEEAIAVERENDGPYFNGDQLCLVDAAYAPFLQRFDFVDKTMGTGLLEEFPKVRAWTDALLANEHVIGSVPPSFWNVFVETMQRRGYHIGPLLDAKAAAE
jgi:glutathione S-transferase